MQNQEHIHNTSEQSSLEEEHISNTDPREQVYTGEQEYTYPSYERGYAGSAERESWLREGDKLRTGPEPKNQKSMGGLLTLLVVLCAVFIAGSLFGVILNWLTWLVVTVLIIGGVAAIFANWRVVTAPMLPRSFQVMEHAQLVIDSGSGKISIRRGEEQTISVSPTRRVSGLGIDLEGMQVNYQQFGDVLNISTTTHWNILQFGLRSIDLEITVPASCDVQLKNGAGQVAIQGMSGSIRVRTGSGRIQAHDLQGEITMKTGSGRVEASNLQGLIDLRTGSSRIEAQNLQGQINLQTGSSSILLERVNGQLTARTGSGRIELIRGALSGDSLLKTGSSSITFDGSLDPRGDYKMLTGSGSINLRLPENTAFTLDAKTGSGGVHNEFGGREVGTGQRPNLKLKTGSGAIRIARGWIS